MICYADTSWWLACKCTDDIHHHQAIRLFAHAPEARVVWTPWQRVEVFNAFRQSERSGIIGHGKARELVRLIEQEVRLGYWPHMEFDWRDAVRTACELSAEYSQSMLIRGMDLFHVSIAMEVCADAFISFDHDQIALAKAAGLRIVTLK